MINVKDLKINTFYESDDNDMYFYYLKLSPIYQLLSLDDLASIRYINYTDMKITKVYSHPAKTVPKRIRDFVNSNKYILLKEHDWMKI